MALHYGTEEYPVADVDLARWLNNRGHDIAHQFSHTVEDVLGGYSGAKDEIQRLVDVMRSVADRIERHHLKEA